MIDIDEWWYITVFQPIILILLLHSIDQSLLHWLTILCKSGLIHQINQFQCFRYLVGRSDYIVVAWEGGLHVSIFSSPLKMMTYMLPLITPFPFFAFPLVLVDSSDDFIRLGRSACLKLSLLFYYFSESIHDESILTKWWLSNPHGGGGGVSSPHPLRPKFRGKKCFETAEHAFSLSRKLSAVKKAR